MTLPRSHYEILGVAQTATVEEIKKRYRELARQLHPDVNKNNPEAAKRFGDVTLSYKVLSDGEARATYDAEQSLMRRGNAAGNNSRTGTRNPANPQRNAPPAASADEMRLLSEAQNAFARGNFVSARALCEEVLRANRRSAQAYEILGDIFRLQSKNEDAARMYTMSLQINPRNPTLLQRLERLPRSAATTGSAASNQGSAGVGASAMSGAPFQFQNRQAQGAPAGANRFGAAAARAATGGPRPIAILAFNVFGYGLVLILVLFVAIFGGEPFDQNTDAPIWLRWNARVLTSLGLCGLLLGVTMATTFVVQRIEDELPFHPKRAGARGLQVPMGLALTVVALANFWVGAVLFVAMGLLRESLSLSMVRVLAATATITLLLCAVYEPGRGAILAFGGSIVFVVLLIGWWLGDFFRPD